MSQVKKLSGYIEYRLAFFTGAANVDRNGGSFETGNVKSSGSKIKKESPHSSENEFHTLGYFFIEEVAINADECCTEKQNSPVCSTRVITSQSMMKVLCDVARFHAKVVITKYSLSYLNDVNNNIVSRVIELHHDGLSLVHDTGFMLHDSLQGHRINLDSKKLLPLKEVQRLEQEMEIERKRNKKERKLAAEKNKCQQYFDITAKIDAISTIITIDPSDPFALIEMYDPDSPQTTTVVILKGADALCCQQAILPGQILSFTNITRSRWHIPKSFQKTDTPQKLHYRASSHVFLVTDSKSIHWNETLSCHLSKISTPKIFYEPPSTVYPLHCIQGRIKSIQLTKFKQMNKSKTVDAIASNVIHHVMIETYNERGESNLCKIYLFYFPQCPDLYLGAKVGCYIYAFNVHFITKVGVKDVHNNSGICYPYHCFGACLRSSITITALASDEHLIKEHNNKYLQGGRRAKQDSSSRNHLISSEPCLHRQFYLFNNINNSYMDCEWITNAQLLSFNNLTCVDSIISVLKQCLFTVRANATFNDQWKKGFQRDPYKEWFDHACDEDEGSAVEALSCCFLTNMQPRPSTTGLLQLRNFAVNEMNDYLLKMVTNVRSNLISLYLGWTNTITLDAKKLYQCHYSTQNKKDLFVGGVITQCSNNDKLVCQLEDGYCQIPLMPIFEFDSQPTSIKKAHLGHFFMTKVHYVVVTCIYIGQSASACEGGNEFETLTLPPLSSGDNSVKAGPCQLTNVGGYIFMIAIQIQYLLNAQTFLAESQETTTFKSRETYQSIPMTKFIDLVDRKKQFTYPPNSAIFTRLADLDWKPYKPKKDHLYLGCTIRFSFLPTKQQVYGELLSIQAMSSKLKIPIQKHNVDSIYDILQHFSTPTNLTLGSVYMSSAWREVAENCQHCPLITSGGNCGPSNFIVAISFGEEAILQMRDGSDCTINSIKLSIHQENGTNDQKWVPSWKNRRCLPGDLHISNSRKLHSNGSKGQLLEPIQSFHGIPTMTIASINYRRIQDRILKQGNLSLVYRIANAQLVALRFCSVRIQCTKCFKYLSVENDHLSNNSCYRKKTKNSIGTRRHFWNEPMQKRRRGNSVDQKPQCNNLKLKCPSGCKIHHALPKWELSSLIDDSTGMAKLYAERDVALALLGKGINTDLVEQAAWQSEEGVVFQQGLTMDSIHSIQKRISSKGASVIVPPTNCLTQSISVHERAHLELEYYAKNMKNKIDILCRAKMSTNAKISLNNTELSTIAALGQHGRVFSSSSDTIALPLLELKLEDCSRCVESTSEIGWSILKSL